MTSVTVAAIRKSGTETTDPYYDYTYFTDFVFSDVEITINFEEGATGFETTKQHGSLLYDQPNPSNLLSYELDGTEYELTLVSINNHTLNYRTDPVKFLHLELRAGNGEIIYIPLDEAGRMIDAEFMSTVTLVWGDLYDASEASPAFFSFEAMQATVVPEGDPEAEAAYQAALADLSLDPEDVREEDRDAYEQALAAKAEADYQQGLADLTLDPAEVRPEDAEAYALAVYMAGATVWEERTSDADRFRGGEGDEIAQAGAGNDRAWGGAGNDMLGGGKGSDSLWGGVGNDTVDGGKGGDRLWGGKGDDDLSGGRGKDRMDGGIGNDVLNGGEDNDKLFGGDGNDTVSGDEGNDKLFGGADDDVMSGGDGKDRLSGGAGNDDINGDDGKDRLRGGAGDDTLDGGEGNDNLSGGAGVDMFVFSEGKDRVVDYEAGEVIDLRGFAADASEYEIEGTGTLTLVIGDDEMKFTGFSDVQALENALLLG